MSIRMKRRFQKLGFVVLFAGPFLFIILYSLGGVVDISSSDMLMAFYLQSLLMLLGFGIIMVFSTGDRYRIPSEVEKIADINDVDPEEHEFFLESKLKIVGKKMRIAKELGFDLKDIKELYDGAMRRYKDESYIECWRIITQIEPQLQLEEKLNEVGS